MTSRSTFASSGGIDKANNRDHSERMLVDRASRDNVRGPTNASGFRPVSYERRDESPPPFRYSRENRERSPSPFRRSRGHDRSPSPYRHRHRRSRGRGRDENRSPSPYRHQRDSRDHGQPNSQGSDQPNSRGFDQPNGQEFVRGGSGEFGQLSSQDYGLRDFRDFGQDGRDHGRGGPYGYKRKRSPQRHGRPEKRHHNSDHPRFQNLNPYQNDRSGSNQPRYQVEKRGDRNQTPNSTVSSIDNDFNRANPDFNNGTDLNGSRKGIGAPTNRESHRQTQKLGDVEMTSDTQNDVDYSKPQVEDPVLTQESREERKRRWALKKAQYTVKAATSEGNTPNSQHLLQQALIGNISEVNTPDMGSPLTPSAPLENSMSPAIDSPRLSNTDSMSASPDVMTVDKQEVVSAGTSPRNEGVSAANYDPTDEKNDDRFRAPRKASETELSSTAVDEKAIISKKKKKKDIDMFAEESDDDEGEDDADEHGAAEGIVLDKKLLGKWTDKDDFYKLIINELVGPAHRYKITKHLGKGMFANVARAVDTASEKRDLVAIKMTRNNDMMRKAAQREAKFLKTLNEADSQDKKHIVRYFDSFDHKGHLCMVFENLECNLRDLLKDVTKGHGIAFHAVKLYAHQIFFGLYHLEACNIIHFDLKPDNILVSADHKTIKICDFGTAQDQRDQYELSDYVVSRFYRAPEIILGMKYTPAVDMWAIGCTLYELWTGKILFTGASNNQMVKSFMECLGWPSEKLLRKGLRSASHFDPGPPLRFLSYGPDPFDATKATLRKIEKHRMTVKDLKTRVHDAARGLIGNSLPKPTELNDFAELLSACLNWNHEKRIKAKDALSHKVFANKALVPRTVVHKPSIPKRALGARK
ncbi:kinase-like protein [Lojkania enalia]|uniref:Kinase-like protein n=1 Tax=Lojkania enalia TaxID=147567 RepID=A0A9P4N5S2_9PLEO|nr:kinase-like protein [Didymosphaeria enalia]